MAIFLNFVVKTALIWLVLGGFCCIFSQSKTICYLHSCYKFCSRVTNLHSCYRRGCTPFSANQSWVILSCILLYDKYWAGNQFDQNKNRFCNLHSSACTFIYYTLQDWVEVGGGGGVRSRCLDFRGIATFNVAIFAYFWRARRHVYCFEPRVILH